MALIERELDKFQETQREIPLVEQSPAYLPVPPAAQVNTDLTDAVLKTNWRWWAVLGFFASVFGAAVLTF